MEAIREEAEKLLEYDLRLEIQELLRSISGLATGMLQEGAGSWAEISEEATKLLQYDAPDRVDDGIKLIESLTRNQFDVRTEREKLRDRGGES